ncbi:hypothetical protein ACFFX1_14330 [Dactylosporangium sucinum]|uniref:Uncharacterized protein n=1 Tax=Dactylosporangium sucinum TaxID=1424081 RepID=A0A917X2U2_9ACTN|nr:hypothetical protein [Dactylosporangium sucinum]GGM63148.1 hypothetical protein GCM10007977_075940 [Dactylosporangium sucinum]
MEETNMVHARRLAVAALVALSLSAAAGGSVYASDPKHETSGDPNPKVRALTNGDPHGGSGGGGDPVG